ncbi:GNAT family N-acetyltransferase [Paraburkholderia panacisoli]
MSKTRDVVVMQGAIKRKCVPVTYRRDVRAGFVVRRFDSARDSFDEMTTLLHRAFARLGEMQLNCTCVDQTVSVTAARASLGDCFVAVYEGRLIGTMTLHAHDRASICAIYRNPYVASVHQFGVDPAWQNRGVGRLLLAFADHWAAIRGYAELALDTPQPATHLLAFYRAQGFRIAEFKRFDGKYYDSAILSRPAIANRRFAAWTHPIIPTRNAARAA